MVLAALIMDVGFTTAGLVPEPNSNIRAEITTFSFNYTFWLNLAFGALAAYFVWLNWKHPWITGTIRARTLPMITRPDIITMRHRPGRRSSA